MSWCLVALAVPVLFVAELVYFRIADRFDIIDKPNERSSHKSITLRGGGIIFYIAIVYFALLFGFPYPYFLFGLTLITFISFIDDVISLSSKVRILFHFTAMAMMFMQWGLFGGELPWWYIVIAFIFCTGVINAYNFMDGINGITGGYSLVVLGSLAYINTAITQFVMPELIYTVIVGCLVFNFFNFRKKAKCFAGDCGSVAMAFIILFLLGKLIIETENLSYIVLLLLYGVDSILTIIHRIMLNENIFEAHRKHAYQIMANELKIPHLVVSLWYMLLQSIIVIGYILCFKYCYTYLFTSTFILCLGYIWFMKRYFYLHTKNN
ncbi:MAG: glycosyltransferase family 4 protein [Bacteroidales bacterium]|nr:glycosyltransferase family 4 protein [Bacteroidales bacterium]